MDDSTQFMLDSLRELQTTLLLLMERAARHPGVQEAWTLEWALTEAVTAYRKLRDGEIGWLEAAQVYQTVSNVQLECDAALLDARMADNYDWYMAKRAISEVQP